MSVMYRNEVESSYFQNIQAWRDQQEAALRAEFGWLTIVGLEWLHEGVQTIGGDVSNDVSLPLQDGTTLGTITLENRVITLHVTADEIVTIADQRVTDAVLFDDAADQGATRVKVRDVTFWVIKRGDSYAIRVSHANAPSRLNFAGRRWFSIDPVYRVKGNLVHHLSPLRLEVDTVIGIPEKMTSPGYVVFNWNGNEHRLLAFNDGQLLWLIFRDSTTGESTYGMGRFLKATVTADGVVDLDFNTAYNPPCAFTPYATCPIPPRENQLPFALHAGEQFPV